MTEPSFDYDDLDAPLTVDDYIEIVADTIDEAVDRLLCAAVRAKISAIIQENRKWRSDDKPASETDRDPNDRWWDR